MTPSAPGGWSIRFHPDLDAALQDGWTLAAPPGQDAWFEPPFLRAVQATLGAASPMEFFVLRGPGGAPAAAGVATRKTVDALSMAPGPLRRLLQAVRRAFPAFLRFRALTCGLPFWGASPPIRWAAGRADPDGVRVLAAALLARARQAGASIVLAHDFVDDPEDGGPEPWRAEGLTPAPSPPDHVFPEDPRGLEDWLDALRPEERVRWRRALDAFDQAGLEIVHTRGGDRLAALFDDRVHALHHTLSKPWEVHFVDLPPAFFRALATAAPEAVRWTFARRGTEVVGYVFSVRDRDRHYQMYLGHAPAWNPASELYTNLLLRDLGAALADGAREVRLGTEIRSGRPIADLKAGLGCWCRARRFYAGAPGPVLRALLRLFAPLLFPPPYASPPRPVFREGPQPAGRG